MAFDDLLGLFANLSVARHSPHGLFLVREGSTDTLLLPRREEAEMPPLPVGSVLRVFVTLDSEDRPVATMLAPKVALDEIAFLTVTDITRFGAFVDWGLPKELLVSLREQTREVARGERHPIALVLDHSGPTPRLAGTMRISEKLASRPPASWKVGDWVEGEAWRHDSTIGTFVILQKRFVGLVPIAEPHRLERGAAVRCRIGDIFPDGKIELSLRALAHTQMKDDGDAVLAVLRGSHAPRLGDDSDPEAIRAAFGLSKKAFKRAVGGLLKRGLVSIEEGLVVAKRRDE